MRTQLREFMTAAEEAEVYGQPYDHTRWDEHKTRVLHTIEFAGQLGAGLDWDHGMDLSCGDGAIMHGLVAAGAVKACYLGDRAAAPHLNVVGPIEHVLRQEGQHRVDTVDLLMLSETIEHLRDPDLVLRLAHGLADWLVVTTPVGETPGRNPEHYWGWDVSDVEEMLLAAGWNPTEHQLLDLPYYTYQMWGCRR